MYTLNAELLERIEQYIEDLFTPADSVLTANLVDAAAAGLPEIQVSANQGKLIYLLAKMARAKRVLEIGTLGGYSTTWLARALPADGSVVSLELDPLHAEVARRNLERAALPVTVDVRAGSAAASLKDLVDSRCEPFDVIFIDADKARYPVYLEYALQLSHPGTLILADNVIRHGAVLESQPADRNDQGAKAYNEAIAHNPRLDSIVLPLIRDQVDGLAISIVR